MAEMVVVVCSEGTGVVISTYVATSPISRRWFSAHARGEYCICTTAMVQTQGP